MRIKIEVTQEHIDKANEPNLNYSRSCPVARAATAAIGKQCSIWPNHNRWQLTIQGTLFIKSTTIETPEEVGPFVDAFDSALEVKPFSFYVEIPDEILA